MSTPTSAPKRPFNDARQAAALEGRRRKSEAALPKNTPEFFVVREPPTELMFRWEIRRFGALVLEMGRVDYSTINEARMAGESALSAFRIRA